MSAHYSDYMSNIVEIHTWPLITLEILWFIYFVSSSESADSKCSLLWSRYHWSLLDGILALLDITENEWLAQVAWRCICMQLSHSQEIMQTIWNNRREQCPVNSRNQMRILCSFHCYYFMTIIKFIQLLCPLIHHENGLKLNILND